VKPLVLHPGAEAELWEAAAYYESKVEGLGADFRAEVERAFGQIRSAPERWPKGVKDTRRYHVRRFPYAIVYLDRPEFHIVIAVAHGKRHPRYWRNRF
jgi:plasmid stabilization system protein ParE